MEIKKIIAFVFFIVLFPLYFWVLTSCDLNPQYKQIGDTKDAKAEFLAKFKDIGIKVNLDNLIRHNTEESDELKKEFVNSKTNEACDTNNTKVVIYPKDPYGEKDYKIEVILECGFETEETSK